MTTDQFDIGWSKLAEIDGAQGQRVAQAVEWIAPDFARLLIEFPFGDI